MRKGLIWKTAAAAVAALLFVCAPMTLRAEKASADTSSEFPCTYTAAPIDKQYMCYGSSAVNTYTAEEAVATGVPDGFNGSVLQVVPLSGGTSSGVLLDFSAGQFPESLVEGLTFRVYIETNAGNTGSRPQVRIAEPFVSNSWVWQPGNIPTPTGVWTEEYVPATKNNFKSLFKDGYLNKFELSVRSNVKIPFYVDEITVNLKENDGVAPVITYKGEDTVYTSKNATLAFDVSAFDEQEQRKIDVEQVWDGESPVLGEGSLKQGTYNLILRATDTFGNVAEKRVTVIVEEEDTEAPVIDLNVSEMFATVGSIPVLQAKATDKSGRVEISYAWSEGALDEFGKLTKGTHTWTVTAKDPSGNVATKVVTFIVTDEENLGDNVVDEEEISTRYTVTFDGKDATTYTYGWKVAKPEAPVKADFEGTMYTFIGWYNGDVEWNFTTDTVKGDLNLISKWTETRAKYTVTFDGKDGVEYEYGDKVVKPEDPTKQSNVRNNYVFDGWYNGDKKWDFNTDVVTGSMELVSKFKEEKRLYTITFDGENSVQYGYGEKIEKPEDPTKEGYAFIGWSKGAMDWDFEEYTVTGDLELTSKWKKVESTGEEDSTASSEEKKEGCGNVIGLSAVGLTVLGAAALLIKKKED